MALFDAVDIIRVKRDGGALTPDQIDWTIDAYTKGIIKDEQMAALAMAIFLRGMDRAEIDVLLTWDYLTLQYRDLTKASVPDANIECHVMKDGALQSGYALVINKYAPHPYAAAATVEYLLSDEGQINRAEGYARPIRSDVELPAELSAKMIPDEEYTNTIPLTDNDAVPAACTEIATRWEEEIIPLMG